MRVGISKAVMTYETVTQRYRYIVDIMTPEEVGSSCIDVCAIQHKPPG